MVGWLRDFVAGDLEVLTYQPTIRRLHAMLAMLDRWIAQHDREYAKKSTEKSENAMKTRRAKRCETTMKLTRREHTKARGFCTGPHDGAPAPGQFGLDGSAECCTCGRRVSVTKLGKYVHHKDFQKTARFLR